MTFRSAIILAAVALSSTLLAKPPAATGCGTYPGRAEEELYLHQRAERSRPLSARLKRTAAARTSNQDLGNIAIIDDSDGVVARRNPFNLDHKTLIFVPSAPSAAKYRLLNGADTFDNAASAAGLAIKDLGDDDAREVPLPFSFPFYGKTYASVWVNSNGNLTFGEGDGNTTEQTLGRLLGGGPRIAALFRDLDPSAVRNGSVRVLSEPARFVVTFDRVPEYSDFNNGLEQTFQFRLYPDGKIEIAYNGISSSEAVTGISPGRLIGAPSVISLASGTPAEFSGPVAEVFTATDAVDLAAAAQKFYATHEDSYDYLFFYNAIGVSASPTAVAYEVTVRNSRTGYGDRLFHVGEEYGSSNRLQSVINMGPLDEYPLNPAVTVDLRRPAGDTPLTILGHEAGHLFLAFTSVSDPRIPDVFPMLGTANVHWAFTFNSEASLLEGNRIRDNGEGASPRFTTIKTVEGYAPLDQYLMGFIPPAEVPPTFYVSGSPYPLARIPQTGISFNGTRHDAKVEDIIAVEGRRTPDSTVSQRRFRFAFVLIVPATATPSPDQVAQVDTYRAAFEDFYAKASGNHATADTALKRAMRFTGWPATGVLQGGTGTASVVLASQATTAETVFIETRTGLIDAPSSVTIPAGSSRVSFTFRGLAPGVEELTLRPANSALETVSSRIQVQASATALNLTANADNSAFRVSDINDLPYSGVRLRAGDVAAVTDELGLAAFDKAVSTPVIESPLPEATRPIISAITNAASYAPGMTPGAYGTIFGSSLGATARVLVNGDSSPVSFASSSQVNFRVPPGLTGTNAGVIVVTSSIASAEYRAPVAPVSPGIFAVVNRGTALEIYATGLNGAVPQVTIGGIVASLLYNGQPQFPGLDQVNVAVPANLPGSSLPVIVTAGGVRSNEYRVSF